MVYIIGNKVRNSANPMWSEGKPYVRESIYEIKDSKLPPVNYDRHTFSPHSITHCESSKHINNSGNTIDVLFENNPDIFFGDCLVLKFKNEFSEINNYNCIKIITLGELKDKLSAYEVIPRKILITVENYPENSDGYHSEEFIVVLNEEAAEYLVNVCDINLFGTTWKSTDYQPGKLERPIHEIIFRKAVIFELLTLNHVPEGIYFFSGIPLYVEFMIECPVTPILIKR